MRRISISKTMLLIALVAGNFAALRALNPRAEIPGILPLLLVALLPLFDAQIIGLYLLARPYRLTVRRRVAPRRGLGIVAFSAFNALALSILVAASVLAPEQVGVGPCIMLAPIGEWLLSLGYAPSDFEAPVFQFFVIPFLVAMILSGPPLLLGLIFGRLANGYELVVARRLDREPTAPPAGVDTTDTQIEPFVA